jgi:D-amino-acid dehydrogenase
LASGMLDDEKAKWAQVLEVNEADRHSVTFDSPPPEAALRILVVDDTLHAGVVPLGNAIRVAVTAEFAGYDLTLPPARIRSLLSLVQQLLPTGGLDLTTAKAWCGLRAVLSDGVPPIGWTAVSNLPANAGHGHLGCTVAVGSALLITNLLSSFAATLRLPERT